MEDVLYTGDLAHKWYDVYSSEHEGVPKALDAILSKRGCKSVIDVGCGNGRNAAKLSDLGYSVFGIDVSSDMIGSASTKFPGIKFANMDMRKIKSDGKFDAAILMDSSFCYMRTNDDCIAALKSISAALKKGGTIVIQTMNVWPEIADGSIEKSWTTVDKRGDKELKIEGTAEIDTIEMLIRDTSTYHGIVNGKEEMTVKDASPVELRIFTPAQIDLLFRLCGFKTVGFYGDLKLGELSKKNCDWLVSIGEKI